ncbi:MAG: hypothetical protein ACI94D_000202 [Neolewinella sp.]|jgi:hypothetical protein
MAATTSLPTSLNIADDAPSADLAVNFAGQGYSIPERIVSFDREIVVLYFHVGLAVDVGILTTVEFSYLKVFRLLEGENVRVTAIFVRKKIEFLMGV